MRGLVVVVALAGSACTAGQARSMGQSGQPYSTTYSERSQYQQQSTKAGPFDAASDHQQRQRDQQVDQPQPVRQEPPPGY